MLVDSIKGFQKGTIKGSLFCYINFPPIGEIFKVTIKTLQRTFKVTLQFLQSSILKFCYIIVPGDSKDLERT